jgi:hypothetical protein
MRYGLAQDAKYKLDALMLVTKFIGRNHKAAFMSINKNDFIEKLKERIDDPSTINQGATSLCGPAVVMFCWLYKRPDLYAQYVINVYESGVGKMGELAVKPGQDCRNYNPTTIRGIDWVALAALRDSENVLLDYDEESDQVSGITYPGEIEKWFNNIGFMVLENDTSLLMREGFSVLKKAACHFVHGKSVCLLVNKWFLDGDGVKIAANHWVVMTSEPTIDGIKISSVSSEIDFLDKSIDFDVYTWGKQGAGSINKFRSNDLRDFLDCFHGFLAVEYNDHSLFAAKLSFLSDQEISLPH